MVFYDYKFSKMGIQKNGVDFFCWKLKRLSQRAAKHTTGVGGGGGGGSKQICMIAYKEGGGQGCILTQNKKRFFGP